VTAGDQENPAKITFMNASLAWSNWMMQAEISVHAELVRLNASITALAKADFGNNQFAK
jgi:hypothetical protein